jgi:uncharacterized protein YozE (UPF0346 family)
VAGHEDQHVHSAGLFLVTTFQHELDILFPKHDAEFHYLARYWYLFHPTNHVRVELRF